MTYCVILLEGFKLGRSRFTSCRDVTCNAPYEFAQNPPGGSPPTPAPPAPLLPLAFPLRLEAPVLEAPAGALTKTFSLPCRPERISVLLLTVAPVVTGINLARPSGVRTLTAVPFCWRAIATVGTVKTLSNLPASNLASTFMPGCKSFFGSVSATFTLKLVTLEVTVACAAT